MNLEEAQTYTSVLAVNVHRSDYYIIANEYSAKSHSARDYFHIGDGLLNHNCYL